MMNDLKFKLFLFTKQFDKLKGLDKKQIEVIVNSNLLLNDKMEILKSNDNLYLLNKLNEDDITNLMGINISLSDKVILLYTNKRLDVIKDLSFEDKNKFIDEMKGVKGLSDVSDISTDALGFTTLITLSDIPNINLSINNYNKLSSYIMNYCINNNQEVYELLKDKKYLKIILNSFSSFSLKHDANDKEFYNKYIKFMKELPSYRELFMKSAKFYTKKVGTTMINELMSIEEYRKLIINDKFLSNVSNERKSDLQNCFSNNIENFYKLRDNELWALCYVPNNETESVFKQKMMIIKLLSFYFRDVDKSIMNKVVDIWIKLDDYNNKYIISLLQDNKIKEFLNRFDFLVNGYFKNDSKSYVRSCSLIRNYPELVDSLITKGFSVDDMDLIKRLSRLPKLANVINSTDDVKMALDNVSIGEVNRHERIGISPVGYSNDAYFADRRELTYIFPKGEVIVRDALFSHSATAFSDIKKYGLLDSKWVDNNKAKIFNPGPLIASLGNIVIISESANEYIYLPVNANTKQLEELFLVYKELSEEQLGKLRIGIAVVTDTYNKEYVMENNIRDINYFMYNEGDLISFDEFVYFLENVYKTGLKKNR